MSRSEFNRNRTRSAVAEKIINKMEDDENPDMQINFGGYMHGGKGFALKVSNMDKISEYTTTAWKNLIHAQGLTSKIITDMLEGTVKIQCEPIEKRQSKKKYFYSLVYLSVCIFLIYKLWTHHHQP